MVLAPERKTAQALPPLQNGDLLTREEFEARWECDPDLKRAELIDGRAYLDVATSNDHAFHHAIAAGWLIACWGGNADMQVTLEGSIRLPGENLPQPDIALRWTSPERARTKVGEKNILEGPPDLVFEVAVSSAARDLTLKKDLYRRNGVQEYIVWSLYEERIDWFALEGDEYVALSPDEDGIIESRVFPGLRLDVGRMLAEDLAGVLAALRSNE